MTLQNIPVVAFLIVATVMEVCGDALVRIALYGQSGFLRAGLFFVGAALLFGYGLFLNLAPRSGTDNRCGRAKYCGGPEKWQVAPTSSTMGISCTRARLPSSDRIRRFCSATSASERVSCAL